MSTTIIKRKRPYVVFQDYDLEPVHGLKYYNINYIYKAISDEWLFGTYLRQCCNYYIYQEDRKVIIDGKRFITYKFYKEVPGRYTRGHIDNIGRIPDEKDEDDEEDEGLDFTPPLYAINEFGSLYTWDFSDKPFK